MLSIVRMLRVHMFFVVFMFKRAFLKTKRPFLLSIEISVVAPSQGSLG